jgi:hypothetical protein
MALSNIAVLKETLDRRTVQPDAECRSRQTNNNLSASMYVEELDALQRPLSPVIPEETSCER